MEKMTQSSFVTSVVFILLLQPVSVSYSQGVVNTFESNNLALRNSNQQTSTPSTGTRAVGDNRLRKHAQSPKYLDAVLKVESYYKNGKVKSCSAALVGDNENQSSKVIVTALHCGGFDYDVYKIDVVAASGGETIRRTAKRTEHASFTDDWAILTLDNKISRHDIKPLIVFTDPEDRGDISVELAYEYSGEITVAGYSGDAEIGGGGKYLTYETFDVDFIFEADEDYFSYEYDYGTIPGFGTVRSFTYPGASGGPVIANVDYEENGESRPYIIAIVKGGFEEDEDNFHESENALKGSLRTKIIPLESFREKVLKVIKQHNY